MKFLEKELPAYLSVDILHLMCPINLMELNESNDLSLCSHPEPSFLSPRAQARGLLPVLPKTV